MSREFLMPELAESVVEGEIVKWLVAPGDVVVLDQVLVEVMTDKVTVELPSPFAGVIERFLAQEGDVVAVHAVMALFADEAGVAIPITAQEERSIIETGTVVEANSDETTAQFAGFGRNKAITNANTMPTPPDGPLLAVPAARALARSAGLDLTQVAGSGPNGRIRLADVEAHLAQAPAVAAAPVVIPATPAVNTTVTGNFPPPVLYKTPKGYSERESRSPLRGMRRTIANQMQASHLYTVRTLTVDEVDMTALVKLRERQKPTLEKQGVKLSYLPFIFKAIAVGLYKHPSLNTSLDEQTQEIVQKYYYNIGMAVTAEHGLLVPVLRDVEGKSIVQLAQEITDIAARTRENKLTAAELGGSSFSVTNIGSIGALFSFPIINVPDAAILGVHSIQKRAVVIEENGADQIVVRQMMYLSLSFDHRLVDGAEAARFCKTIIRLLENPELLLLEG
jgi:2-oxoisovalerate dehydrogenase E2 component (dihydrolipoyl transacylase)